MVLRGLVLGACLIAMGCAGSKHFGPSREFLTATSERYGVSMQKNGRVDALLGSDLPVFDDAYSMVWIEGEPEPRVMNINGAGGSRQTVNDPLGQGHGLLYVEKDSELLIQTYPTQPFFTVQTSFKNNTSAPVKVKMLLPWCVGRPNPGALYLGPGADTAAILENGRVYSEGDDFPRKVTGNSLSQWNATVYNPATGRTVLAGFLTNVTAYTQIRIERTPETPPDRFDLFRAECVYDPPVEVPPGGVLRSERLYVSIAERDPHTALERFGHAMAITNGKRRYEGRLPHGWDSWNTKYKTGINEEAMLASLDYVDKNLKRYGWTHFAVDAGWERMRGDWEANPETFPHGMKWLADRIHERGMTAGIWIDAFLVDVNAPIAKEHPEWLRGPNEMGKELVAENERILDITAPGAYEYVRGVFARIGREWGYDALMEADFVYLLALAESYHDTSLTRIQVLRKGMEAIREGFGSDKFVMSMPPLPVTGTYATGMRIGNDCAPIWTKVPDQWPWGCVEALTNAARRYYFAPSMWVPDQDCAYFGHAATRERWNVAAQPPLTEAQSIAWLTGAALTGGVVKIGDNFADLSPSETALLKRLLPVPERPARPIDLFESEHPQIWYLPAEGDAGKWHILALFNWDAAAEQVVSVSLERLGLSPDEYYTVYNFWGDVYHGTVRGNLQVNVPPGSVQLYGLRAFENRPMLLAVDRHIQQGALEVKRLNWDRGARRLTGVMETIPDTDYGLRILVPSPYALANASVSAARQPNIEMVGQLLKVNFHCTEGGRVEWVAQF